MLQMHSVTLLKRAQPRLACSPGPSPARLLPGSKPRPPSFRPPSPRSRAPTLTPPSSPHPHPGARASWSAQSRGDKGRGAGAQGHCATGPRSARAEAACNGTPAAVSGQRPRAPGLAAAGKRPDP
ncbi:PREDICTED: forkhead box protein D1-like [Chinchilla lanigera]|uniref:forkhead box protein D1-like n=1 Tax=Chinchilla lanigera TaxID=34839 RepID=UPI0006967BD8|nr:PREDICTED: forkhead box protein D1-like [Chinchilla lanigera]